MNIRSLLDDLSSKLSVLERKVQLENKTADYSLNIHLENLYIKILNKVFDYNLVNVNEIKTNFAGIDALDTVNGIAIQITSTFSKKKIENTIDKIISNKLKNHFERLQFFFLTPKKELAQASKTAIKNKINEVFQLNIEKDLLDGSSIHQELYYQNNTQKIIEVLALINDFIDLNSEKKFDSIESVVVMFDNTDLEKTYLVIDAILKNLINVYVVSKELYNTFKNKKHKLLEYLILVNKNTNLEHLNYSIVVLSNTFIKNNLESNRKECILLEKTIENNNRVFIVSFDSLLEINKISSENKEFKTFQTIPKEGKNLEQFVNDKIIKQIITEQADDSYAIKDIINELKTSYHNFNSEELSIENNTNFNCLKFEMEGFQNVELFYLILNKNYNLKQVQVSFKEIVKKHKINLNNLIVLVPKDFKQKTRRRLELVKRIFNNNNKVYFIDEFIFDKRFKSYPKQCSLAISDFVAPIIKADNDTKGLNDIMHWIMDVSNSPISIITAPGGVGKTTLCEKIHDKIISDYERCIVIFIDPDNFLEMIKKVQLDENYNIYSLYKACSVNSDFINDEQTFLLNYKLGNIVMIFDGIDETISTVQNFTLEKFIKKLMSLEQKIGKGKIIINCRDNYIEDFKQLYTEVEQIQFYNLLPFNKPLAKEYFKNHFKTQPKKVKECLNFLDEFVLSKELDNEEFLYPPFVLEIIRQVVQKEFDYSKDLTFTSAFLVEQDIIDYIFYKTCNREITKKDGQGFVLDVDSQVRFMIKLAIEEKGQIKKNEIERLLIENDRSQDFAKGIVDHPFLLNTNAHYEFRFSFLQNHFKAIHLFKLIKEEKLQGITDFDIKMFAHEFNYNSLVFKGVINKVKKNVERNFIINIKNLIDVLLSKEDKKRLPEIKKRAISNLFILTVELSKILKTDDSTSNIIQKIFGNENNEVKNFYLFDVSKEMNLILNFKGLYISTSQVANFANFFRCKFNDNTFFEETCNISGVYDTSLNFKNITATQNNFDKNIKGDNSITKTLMFKSKPDKIIIDSLKTFFKCFYDGRNLKFNKSVKEIESHYKQKVKLNTILKEFSKCELITISENRIKIEKVYHRKINKFIFEGLNFTTLNDAIRGIIEHQN